MFCFGYIPRSLSEARKFLLGFFCFTQGDIVKMRAYASLAPLVCAGGEMPVNESRRPLSPGLRCTHCWLYVHKTPPRRAHVYVWSLCASKSLAHLTFSLPSFCTCSFPHTRKSPPRAQLNDVGTKQARVLEIDYSEMIKPDAALTCCSVLLGGQPAA